ncbi:ABC-F family ATP-binding cassette domain-containing protein [Albidovulum sediminis]|uniref:ATP-binding cassette domain-containing protein n=1 Tax=Albidovulum sediminis TaxID=3066345 RepID=A0ABT2NL69_9RHOB|nr:ABC-F family ATP-binding cassette domain-containing protein [Defluviimonas sediminis]MCT8329652.1 ATP-binding cassette domain-containing protein [Defluviimonas sediminis]
MSLLSVSDLGLTLADPLFSGLDFTLHPGDRAGLVAANGRGKSSLLRVLAGLAEPTQGSVTRARGAKVALVEQDPPAALLQLTLRAAVLDGLPEEARDYEGWRVDVALDDLGVPEDLRDRPLAALSGGWQRTALLARAAVGEPDLYLLDEPTNHLDLARIGVLTRWLAALPRSVAAIIVSHDRAFLDAATTRTLFLRERDSRVFALPFSAARAALEEADAADARAFDNRLKEAQQLRRQAAKLKNIGINSGSDLLTTKTKQLTERADRIEAAARPAHRDRSAGAIRLEGTGSHARALLAFEDAAVATPDGRLLFRTGRKWIVPGDRVVLLGPNGAGKSRLMAAVRAALEGDAGAIRAAPSVRAGVADQHLGQIDLDRTPHALLADRFRPGDQAIRAALAGAGIAIDRQTAPTRRLSGGQRSRLAMLLLRFEKPNLYLLDEPTNHLDIEGQEALEAEIATDAAAALIVSHDRAFVRAVGTRFWLIAGRRLEEVDSPEDFFREAEGGAL